MPCTKSNQPSKLKLPDYDVETRVAQLSTELRDKRPAPTNTGTTARSVRARSNRDADHAAAANVLMQPPLVPTYNPATPPTFAATSTVILPTGVRNGALSTGNPGDAASEANASLSSGWLQDVLSSTSSPLLTPTLPMAVSSTSSSANLLQSSNGSVVLSPENGSLLGGLAPAIPGTQARHNCPYQRRSRKWVTATALPEPQAINFGWVAARELQRRDELGANCEELKAELRIAKDTGDKALRQVAELASQVHTLATAQRQQHRQPRRTSSSETDSTLAINKR